MKSKHEEKKESLFQKKGFYAALYSCVGIVLVLAAIIAYNAGSGTVQSPVAPNEYASEDPIEENEMQTTLSQTTRSYLTPDGAEEEAATQANADEQGEEDVIFFRPKASAAPAQPAATPAPAKTQEAPAKETPKVQEAAPTETSSGSSEAEPEEERPYEAASVVPSGLDGRPISSSEYEMAAAGAENLETVDEIAAAPVFSIFGDDQEMVWPVSGEIVMDYSIDRTVYDKTLEQFRTNNSISIAAAAGTPVKAAAEGVVTKVSDTREDGVSVTIDHGNGWTSTYSQLSPDLLVAEGDVLLGGQEFAAIGNPSIYSVLLGDHLGFSVTKNDASQDPKTVLAALE